MVYGPGPFQPLIACALGAAYSLAGRSLDAIALLEEGIREGLTMGRLGGHSLLLVRLGEAYLRANRLDEADDAARQALLMARENIERGHEAYALHLLGEVVARRTPGDPGAADAAFQQASAFAEELSMRSDALHPKAIAARAAPACSWSTSSSTVLSDCTIRGPSVMRDVAPLLARR